MRSVGSRYKQAGGELVSLDRYAGTEDQLTYRETYFDPLQHGPEEIAIRHDHSQWVFYSLLDLPRRERKYAVYRFGYPDGKKKSRSRMNSTPFVRQYGILLTSGVLFYAKRESKQEVHRRI